MDYEQAVVLGADGSSTRRIDFAEGRGGPQMPSGQGLNGPQAWSPDDSMLALIDTDLDRCVSAIGVDEECDEQTWQACMDEVPALSFVSSGAQPEVSLPGGIGASTAGDGKVLGWRGEQKVLVMDASIAPDATNSELHYVTAISLTDGTAPRVSAINGAGNFGVGKFQIASGLVPDMRVEEAGSVDRGPWAWGPAVAASLMAALVAAKSPASAGVTGPCSSHG